ncbi:hypothetical protein AYO37_00985 [Opitutia bacterium SCGC AG-212-L18]|nr:hypothetical protein AYO37_00985 [Opitutae bacterium SCGC AG-212-L18]
MHSSGETSDTSLVDRELGLRDLYTDENITKNVNAHQVVIKRRRDDKYCDLYEESMKVVVAYLEGNKFDDEKFFYLCLFKAKIASHLHKQFLAKENYNKAQLILEKGIGSSAKWVNNIDLGDLRQKLIKGKLKHQLISSTPLRVGVEFPCTSKDALLSKTYLERELKIDILRAVDILKTEQLLSEVVLVNELFDKLFESLQSTKFSRLVSQLNALDALEHPRFSILFILLEEVIDRGEFNSRNTIRVYCRGTRVLNKEEILSRINNNDNDLKRLLFHELIHRAMQIFGNNCKPYFKDDELAIKAYRDSMKQVLINIIRAAASDFVINLDNLGLNELVELCFGGNEEFLHINRVDEDVRLLINSLHCLFGVSYSVKELDLEFITNVTDCIVLLKEDSECHKMIQPLMDYVDKYVIPEIEKYIEGHPRRNQLKDD